MLREERIREILLILKNNGKVEIPNLCRLFNVTEMTARRDLNHLAKNDLAIRSYGGAISIANDVFSEQPYQIRINYNLKAKEAIAKAALQFIKDKNKLFFDSSTTVYCLARILTNENNLLITTDMLSTAIELNTRKNIEVICLGGELQKNTVSCMGVFAEKMLDNMHFDTCFIGISSISDIGSLSTSSISEFSIKRKVISRSKKVIILADNSKFGKLDFLEISNLKEVDLLITDTDVSKDMIQYCEDNDIKIIIA